MTISHKAYKTLHLGPYYTEAYSEAKVQDVTSKKLIEKVTMIGCNIVDLLYTKFKWPLNLYDIVL